MADRDPTGRPELQPTPPEKPLPSDCCGGGCTRCVYDVYEDALASYESQLAQWKSQ